MTPVTSAEVGIIGAGPAGLFLAHLLDRAGIESVVLEQRSRYYVERRVRAGVLEQGAAQMLRDAGAGERLDREGLEHGGVHLRFDGESHRIDFHALTGRTITVYGQQEIVKDLIAARVDAGSPIVFEAGATRIGDRRIDYTHEGRERTLQCDFIAGCDGAHGVGRRTLLERGATVYEHHYPHAWLGILAATPPAVDELIYSYHERGFALQSMRSPEVSRLYLQVASDETLDAWSPERIWSELRTRLDQPNLEDGEILDIGITEMTSLVLEPMQQDGLFLAGDSAHIVPPTGAKGMNLALADAATLAQGLAQRIKNSDDVALREYSARCLQRVWRAQHFSSFMTQLLHREPGEDAFDHRLHLAQLRQLTGSRAAMTSLAESYTGAATGDVTVAQIRS